MYTHTHLTALCPTHTHTHLTALCPGLSTSRYQLGKTNLDFTGARDSEWHQLGQMQVCTSLQTDNNASTPPLSFFTGRMPFLPHNQQHQSTEGNALIQCTDMCCIYNAHSVKAQGLNTRPVARWQNDHTC